MGEMRHGEIPVMSRAVFSKRLRKAMAERGMSAKSLSFATGLATSTVQQYMSGKRSPTVPSLTLVRWALGCTWEELLGE